MSGYHTMITEYEKALDHLVCILNHLHLESLAPVLGEERLRE